MFTHFFLSFFSQTAGKVNQNGDILAAVRQHDRRVGFRQPRVRERSKYRCHEHARRGFTEHQRAVLIPFPSGCHPGCCHLTVHQQRAPCASPFILHQQQIVAFSGDVAHKNIKKGKHPLMPLCRQTPLFILDLQIISLIVEVFCFCNPCHVTMCYFVHQEGICGKYRCFFGLFVFK